MNNNSTRTRRSAPITMTDLSDHDGPIWVITMAGMRTVCISGFGKISWGAAIKCEELGARVVTLSGPDGYIFDPDGVRGRKIDFLLRMIASNRDRIQDYADEYGVEFVAGKKPWEVPCDLALPCATQNDLSIADAQGLVENGCRYVVEATNMSCVPDAIDYFQQRGVILVPAKAGNIGGFLSSTFEYLLQFGHFNSFTEQDELLRSLVVRVHEFCLRTARTVGFPTNYVIGANVASFCRVAEAMLDQGVV